MMTNQYTDGTYLRKVGDWHVADSRWKASKVVDMMERNRLVFDCLVVLQNACAARARWFHLGESATPGAVAFKELLGARPYELDEFELERIPLWRPTEVVRSAVKKLIGFREGVSPESADRNLQRGNVK